MPWHRNMACHDRAQAPPPVMMNEEWFKYAGDPANHIRGRPITVTSYPE
jgi:hypothetical protein